jgi:hypothetical protein
MKIIPEMEREGDQGRVVGYCPTVGVPPAVKDEGIVGQLGWRFPDVCHGLVSFSYGAGDGPSLTCH